MNIEKITAYLWRLIELITQVIIVFVLAALLLGENAGSAVNHVYYNVRIFLMSLPPSSIAVALLIAVFFWWKRK